MATTCGYTQQEIDLLTLPFVLDLFTYWKTTPPMHEMVAAYLGIGKKSETDSSSMTPEDMAVLLESSGGKIARNMR